MAIECGSCGKALSEEFAVVPRIPCPGCGSTRRVFSESLISKLEISGSAVASQRFGHTGREVLGGAAEKRVVDWASLHDHDKLAAHPVAEDLRALLSATPQLSGDKLILFRGAGIRDSEPRPPLSERMGPLPKSLIPKEGRYHREGERVLYLADSEDGVRREMEAWHTQGTPYVIRVEVPLTSLRIADFSNWPVDHLITAVFSRAEMCNVAERGPKNYVLSQVVGRLVAERFDGMRIPGVRGGPGGHYRNVVLFRQLDEWPNWIDPQMTAYRLFSPQHDHIAIAAYYLWEKDGRTHGRDLLHWFNAIDDLP